MSLKYEPSSEPLHISVKSIGVDVEGRSSSNPEYREALFLMSEVPMYIKRCFF